MVSKPPKLLRTDLETAFQAKVVKFLRSKGCFVWKCQQNSTTQAGVADLFFCYGPIYGVIEIKKSLTAPYRPGQREFLEKIGRFAYAQRLSPENFDEQKEILDALFEKADLDMAKISKNGRCKVVGCLRPARSAKSGLCSGHYGQVHTHGRIVKEKMRVEGGQEAAPTL